MITNLQRSLKKKVATGRAMMRATPRLARRPITWFTSGTKRATNPNTISIIIAYNSPNTADMDEEINRIAIFQKKEMPGPYKTR